jgi:NitT/TauT family transport system permease protein
MGPSNGGLQQQLGAAWLRPVIFLVSLVVGWDLAIRVFHIPPYQIPAPMDVVMTLWQEWPMLLAQAWPTTLATIEGFLLSAAFGIPIAMLIAGSRTVESYVYPLLVFSQSIPKIAIAPLFVVWFGFGMMPKVLSAFLLGFFRVVAGVSKTYRTRDGEVPSLRPIDAGFEQKYPWQLSGGM